MAVRRSDFLKVGAFGGIGIAEDVDWGRRASALGLRLDFVADMAVETPARRDYADLARKWDRHIAHDLAAVSGFSDRLRWAARALALAASPVLEIPRILSAPQLEGPGERLLAWRALAWIRLYRSRRMFASLAGSGPSSAAAWRRE